MLFKNVNIWLHNKYLFLDQRFSVHEHLAPKFWPRSEFFRFYIIKIAKVGLRMKVEMVGMQFFVTKFSYLNQDLSKS